MPTQTYEALLADPKHVAQVRAAQPVIERLGGTIQFIPNQQAGLTLIVVTLPVAYRPDTFFPGLPFYLI